MPKPQAVILLEMSETFSIGRAFAGWWRDSVHERGLRRTLARLVANTWELLRDLTPARRRLRFGDLDFDWENGVNTTWANPSMGTRVRELFTERGYMPTDPELFREVVGGLGIDYPNFTFIDLGCGKGRALLLASEYAFRRIIGVELLPEMHRVAEENARRFHDGAEQHRIELCCGDAREFTLPAEPLVIFLFDPFPEHILEQVIANMERSIREQPRPLIIVYQNPISEHVLSNTTWLKRVRGDIQAAVYESNA
jgi:SAM-dependent methyltransferase